MFQDNGLFTSKLLKVINEPNLNVTDVFKKVKQEVYAESKKSQLPSVEDNSIGGDFYFTGGGTGKSQVNNTPLIISKPEIETTVTDKTFDYGYGIDDSPRRDLRSRSVICSRGR